MRLKILLAALLILALGCGPAASPSAEEIGVDGASAGDVNGALRVFVLKDGTRCSNALVSVWRRPRL